MFVISSLFLLKNDSLLLKSSCDPHACDTQFKLSQTNICIDRCSLFLVALKALSCIELNWNFRPTDWEGGCDCMYSQRASVRSLEPTSAIGWKPGWIINVPVSAWWSCDSRTRSEVEVACRVPALMVLYVHLDPQQLGLIYSNQSSLFGEINSFCHRGPVVLETMTIKKMCRKYMGRLIVMVITHCIGRTSDGLWEYLHRGSWCLSSRHYFESHCLARDKQLRHHCCTSRWSFMTSSLWTWLWSPLTSSLTCVIKAPSLKPGFPSKGMPPGPQPTWQSSNTCVMMRGNPGFAVSCLTKQSEPAALNCLCFIRDAKL